MAASKNPISFTQQQLQANRDAQRQLADLLPLLDKADQCGIPTAGYRSIAAGLKENLAAIEHNFMKHVS